MTKMAQKDWDTFSELLNRIVHLDDMTTVEKRAKVMAEVDSVNLDEFVSWFDGTTGDSDDE